ncbi:MAG TPA: hypothetical protein VFU73_12475 [Actinocrinis sp.]|nr:hypothetical protein [Actinocrinis sp.]
MSTTDDTPEALDPPAWLAPALQRHNEARAKLEETEAAAAARRANLANLRLKKLGITPVRPAASSGRHTSPAILVQPWTIAEERGVEADVEPGETSRVVLTVVYAHNPPARIRFGPLTSIDDVARALCEGPTTADMQPETIDHASEAETHLRLAKRYEYASSQERCHLDAAQVHATLATLADHRTAADLRYRLAAIERLITPVEQSTDGSAAMLARAVREIARFARTPESALELVPPGNATILSGLTA